jgi:hypothetical protein
MKGFESLILILKRAFLRESMTRMGRLGKEKYRVTSCSGNMIGRSVNLGSIRDINLFLSPKQSHSVASTSGTHSYKLVGKVSN